VPPIRRRGFPLPQCPPASTPEREQEKAKQVLVVDRSFQIRALPFRAKKNDWNEAPRQSALVAAKVCGLTLEVSCGWCHAASAV
jgi:hypothetical protein